uniref:Thrombospondin type-1 domain-containing protein 7A n=1 Tax=Geotrypetes seraphini TaxID=260995 RepID=A0A6P8QT71_GEOSA|nr:thrombospondin type-1 domain-containing protein 7B isoform X3 [Geotrypetes seraphini]
MFLGDKWALDLWPWWNIRKVLILMILLLLQIKADLNGKKENQFIWKTGHWGRCMGDCGPGGIQSRTVWCVHIEGWTAHHSNCKEHDRLTSQRHCFKICDWHNELFEWDVSDWEDCVLVPFAHGEVKPWTSECVTAQHGLQHRNVRCIQQLNRTVVANEICEYFTPQPPVEQACLIPCPRDCVVSEFSPWSECSKACGKSLQHRTRSVISPPLYGGLKCPNLTESRSCNYRIACPVDEEHKYNLKVGPWSECRLPHLKEVNLSGRTMLDFSSDSTERSTFKHQSYKHHHSKPWEIEIGYQTRQVRCTRSDGKNAMLSICTQGNTPLTFQSCVIPKDCDTSEWSPWGLCSKTCQSGDLTPGFRSRSRNVKHLALGGGRECPQLEEKEACNIGGELLPLCPRFLWKSSEWKECQVAPLFDQQDPRRSNRIGLCGGGIQTREVYCSQTVTDPGMLQANEVTRPVELKSCTGHIPATSQLCSVQCPVACVVSSWSAWGLCISENCQEPQRKKGFKMRRRYVIGESIGSGESCSHLVESLPCEDPTCFRWVSSGKGICVADNGDCGQGKYIQKGECKNDEGEKVPDELCIDDPSFAPTVCHLACSADCVTSEWSSWSSCSHSCSSKNAEGKQNRRKFILALPGEGGKACPPSQALQEYRLCNEHSCTAFYWETSPWGPCSEDTLITALNATTSWNGAVTCGVGIQNRKVFCMKNNASQGTSRRCSDSTRPETVRPCLLPCRKDCLVTPFSEWTPCPTICQQGKCNMSFIRQSRYRIIIQEAANGGQECPDTLFEERECEEIPICPTYRWKTHKWNQCVLVPDSVRQGILGANEACGSGLQSRAVTCISDEGLSAEVTECLIWSDPMPPLVQECLMACRDDCTFTPWSKFTPCPADCESKRNRRRSLTGRSRKRDKCQNAEIYPQVETEACPCEVFTAKPYGNWSDCIIPEERSDLQLAVKVHGDIKECGEGVQRRAMSCHDQNGRLVDPSYCNGSGYVEKSCVVPCPFDCKLSGWSSWSPCSSSCGTGVKIRSKWLKEKPYNGGRPCPKLDLKNQVYEAVPCYSECNQYSWVADPWSPCRTDSVEKSPHCGKGIQTRKIRCVNGTEDGDGETVISTRCSQYEIPADTQNCTIFCLDDCVMSEWGQWSKFPQMCDSNGMRTRNRFPLRSPVNSKTCHEDSQTEPCILNQNCFHYRYNLTEWSTCQLSENATCGPGIRTRILDCIRSDGKSVHMKYCEKVNSGKPMKMSLHCLVECAVDCQLSLWSPWSQCSQTCGAGGQTRRSRNIIMQTQGEGRPCPTQLTQYQNCPVYPCYDWVVGEWTQCKVEGGQCGDGLQVRNLTCVVHDAVLSDSAKQVESNWCGAIPSRDNALQLPCYVPCPGDCHLTEWSVWSACELTCIDGRSFETIGRQSRSRAFIIQSIENQESCPEQVLETRPCIGGKCYRYEWKASLWSDNERNVWCQRSDGINVTGGCLKQTKPATTRHCDPPCKKPFSYCTQNGVCGCEKGYAEVMRSNGFLDYCIKIPGLEDKKADVKTFSGKNRHVNSKLPDIFKGWSIQPLDPDGRIKMWVYGVSVVGFLLIVFLIFTSYLVCKKPKEHQNTPQQKPLSLAYDGDIDM